MDMNDRSLRHIIVGLGGTASGIPRETGFDITAASEVMAILCLSEDFADLKERLGNIFIGYTYDKQPIYARDLKANGAMAALLKEAIKPNLVQTIEGNPAIIHGGPFANIAQGTNSIIATKMGLSLSDFVVTEAGFGFDLGAEKFFDIKCVKAGLSPVSYTHLLKAYYHTKFFSPQLQGVCDSMAFPVADSTVYLSGSPIVWASGNQMTATAIDMLMNNNVIQEFHLNDKAMTVSYTHLDVYKRQPV